MNNTTDKQKIEQLEAKIRLLEHKIKEQDEFIDDMFKVVKKHKQLKFRNVVR